MKKHFQILDGLRGTAAVFVVVYHLLEVVNPNPLVHGHLAVDFFFLLSGYVIGYAYDNRFKDETLTVKGFFLIRLTRLHPLVVLSIVIGALGYWFDPFAGNKQPVNGRLFTSAIMLGLLLLPSPSMPNRDNETHSLNGPSWSLFQEYLINIAYALFGHKLGKKGLIIIVIAAAIILGITAIGHGHLQAGWGWDSIWVAPVRVTFPFFAGLLIYRMRWKISLPMAYLFLSLALFIVFAWPFNRYYGTIEFLDVLIVFPLIVIAGAGSIISGYIDMAVCGFFGRISYPIYIIHYPFVYVYKNWVHQMHPSKIMLLFADIGFVIFIILLAWLLLRYYDEPVRGWLNRVQKKYNQNRPVAAQHEKPVLY